MDSNKTISSEDSIKGIYYIKINGKYYIGKDTAILGNTRIKQHLNLLKKGEHYNTYLQYAYDKYKEFEYGILDSRICSLEELSQYEKMYIDHYDSYNNGYNLTIGGEGTGGYKYTEEQKEDLSKRFSGEKNGAAKLTNKQFYEIVEMLKAGNTNLEIAERYGIHDRYVSLIRHKKRFKRLWDTVEDYTPIASEAQLRNRGKVTEEMFVEIVKMLNEGATNAAIERRFNLSAGTGSRIRHKKLYKQWWDRLIG